MQNIVGQWSLHLDALISSDTTPLPPQILRLMAETMNIELNIYLQLAERFISLAFPAEVHCKRVLKEHKNLIYIII
jgi:hypothetical protein